MKEFLLTTLFIIFCLTSVHAQPSLLDASFGTNGIVKANLGNAFNYTNIGKEVLVQSDGSMYFVFEGAGLTLIGKKHADGSTDITYGNNGFSVAAPIYSAHAVLQADGKIIIAGYTINADQYSNPTDFAVARFNTNGSLDNTFGTGGIQVNDLGAQEGITSLTVQGNGKIVAVGYTFNAQYHTNSHIVLLRYNMDGSPDSAFDGDGITETQFGFYQTGYSLAIQGDGKIIVTASIRLTSNSNTTNAFVRYNNDGTLDLSFNGTGYQPVGFSPDQIAIQADDKIVIAGSSSNGNNNDFALARYDTDGSPDNTFDGDGVQTTDFGGTDDMVTSISIQSDGKIILAGYASNGTSNDFAIARYKTDGSLDNTFSDDGKQVADFTSSDDYANSIAIQSDGKLVVLGYTVNGSNTYLAAARYNNDGSLDDAFDSDGKLVDHINQGDTHFTSTAIQSNGKAVVAGYTWNGTNYDFALVRYNTNGSLDNTFADGGKQKTDFGSTDDKAREIAIQNDGKIVVAGSSGDNFGIARYNTDGSLDNTFDGDGFLTTAFVAVNTANAMVLQSDGKIIVGGSSGMARYNTDGSLDVSFNGNGKLTAPFKDSYPFSCNAIALQTDGKIVITGNSNTDCIIARYNIDGSIDNTFGYTGVEYVFDFTNKADKCIAIQSDGKIVTGGNHLNSYRTTQSSFLLQRFNTDGKPDETFGTDGIVNNSPGGHNLDYGTSLLLQSDGKIILAGSAYNGSSNDFAIVRYNTDGSLDNTFSGDGIEITKASTAYSAIAGTALADGQLYAAGYGQYPGNFGVVARYLLASGGPLPVTLANFTAVVQNQSVLLQWHTLSEQNLSYFIVERSADGNNFSPIGDVAATGNSNTKISYSTLDRQPLAGANFYRLKLIDKDGKPGYSKIVSVNINQLFTLKISPNPAENILLVQATGANETAIFQVTDASGRRLKEVKVYLNGNTSFSININTLSKGIYNLQLRTKTKIETRRFVKE